MKAEDIIELGRQLRLPFKRESNFPDMLARDKVVFDGCNGQRFLIDGELTDEEIMWDFGNALINYGARLKCMQLQRVMSTNSDSLDIPDN
jgi:hypothetical protein